jgi:TRAP-type transport system small permease protein
MEFNMKSIKRLYQVLFIVVRTGAEICVFSMIGLLVIDVFARYVIGKATLVSYDLTGYYLVGITYLGAAYALREGSHIRITVFTDYLPPKIREWWFFFIDLVAFVFIFILFVKSIDLVRYSFETAQTSMSFMGEPMWIPELLVPIGLGLYVMEEILGQAVIVKRLFCRGDRDV